MNYKLLSIFLISSVIASIMFRIWFKWNKIDPIRSILIMWIWMTIIWIIAIIITKKYEEIPKINNIYYLAISIIWSCIWSISIMLAMQNWINMNIFTPLQNVFTIIAVAGIGYIFWDEKLNYIQIWWILFSAIWIYMLLQK